MRAAAAVLAFLAATLATAGGTGSLPPELARGDLQAWLDGYFPYALARDDIAGAAVVVVRDGAVLAARGYGHADVANGIRVDPARTLGAAEPGGERRHGGGEGAPEKAAP